MNPIDSKTIINYLKYLRDTSRKIGTRSNFENVFLKKTKRSNSYTVQIKDKLKKINPLDEKNPLFQNLNLIHKYLERNSDKKLFLGAGVICGLPKIAGPLLVTECELYEDNRGILTLEIDLSTLILNYDLISRIIENKLSNISEDDFFLESIEKESEIINILEEKLLEINKVSQINKIAEESFSILKDNLDEFRDIEIIDSFKYDYETEIETFLKRPKSKETLFNKGKLSFINANHLFIAPVPNEISTYQSLSKLIEEIEKDGSFRNEVIGKLLGGVFSNDIVKINYKEDIWRSIDKTIDLHLPLPISSAQLKAIKNAFSYEISYVQGPPGTGKSHTISAIVLASIILGKKILVVSQKPPAVKVIKEKITPYLEFNPEILPLVYFDKNLKQELRSSIKNLLSEYASYYKLNKEKSELEEEIYRLNNKLNTNYKKLEESIKELENNLELEKTFAELNEEFQELKKYFQEKHYALSNNLKVVNENIIGKFKVILEDLKKLEEKYQYENKASIIFKLNTITNILKYFSFLAKKNYLINALRNNTLSILLKDILEIEQKLSELNNIKRKIRGNNELLRKEIEFLKREQKKLQKDFIKTKNKLRVLSKLAKEDFQDALSRFSNLLYFKKASKVSSIQKQIDWDKILEIFPVWISEIRHLNEILPMKDNLFDLVIVDEASQVNLAEIIPVFYRGKNICIVGDHKQLSLNSTGLNFQLSVNLDRFTWEKYRPSNLSYSGARNKNLTVTTASILDFIRSEENNFNIVEIMLDEHFRSLPALANFTNNKFYDGKLKIMTETPDKALINCFLPVKVNGKRTQNKTIEEEAVKVIEIVKYLISSKSYKGIKLPDVMPDKFSIGIISIIRHQVELIKDLLEEKINSEDLAKYEVIAGTPEELQGHERDVMIFSLCLDRDSFRSSTFYQNRNRFNVATSRAKYFTFVVYSEIPHNFNLIRSYFNNFGYDPEMINISDIKPLENPLGWKFNPDAYESEFERIVYYYLQEYIKKRHPKCNIKIFNQVKACGQKRLDFVLYNPENKKFVAVEVDGIYHFELDGKTYSQAHLERIEILKRAGWEIINTPYYKWYKNGWLDENSHTLKEEIKRIYKELDKVLCQ
ncbi:AAA domain-containing protein [Persephonella sp.]